jgi:hypothetical protein
MSRLNVMQALAAAAIALPCAAARADLTYQLIDLPPIGDDGGVVMQVNDLGHGVVQTAGEDGITGYAFWTKEQGYQFLDYRGEMIRAKDMNNRDQVVGTTDSGGLGAIWSPAGLVTFSAPAGYQYVYPKAIDDDGRVYGMVTDAAGVPHTFHRTPAGEIVVDRPDQASCAMAANDRRGAVVQTMAPPNTSCDCFEPHPLYLVHDHEAHRIKAPTQDPLCIVGMDDQGDVLIEIYGSSENSPGLWSRSTGYVPIDKPASYCCELAGVADGGVVAARAVVRKYWQAFLWDRESGSKWVRNLIYPPQHLEMLSVLAVSPHGVLGGNVFWNPVILVPSHWESAARP